MRLALAPSPGAVQLSWTTNAIGYLLETNATLTLPAGRSVLTSNYSILSTNYVVTNSDRRIKTDIKPVQDALSALEKVRLVSFRYNDDYRAMHRGVEDRRYLNVVAQEFREVFPEHVQSSGEKLPNGDDILQVDTYPLTIYSAAAIQELNARTEAQLKVKDTEIQQLKQRFEKLEQFMNQKNGGAK